MSKKILLDEEKVKELVKSEKALKEEATKLKASVYEFQVEAANQANVARIAGLKAEHLYKENEVLREESRGKGLKIASALIDIARLKNELDFQQSWKFHAEKQRDNLKSEVEEKRKTIQQLRDQLGLGYKMGLGTMPIGEEERSRWKARVHEQLRRQGELVLKIQRMRSDANNIEFLKARIRRIEGGAPILREPIQRGTVWHCPECKGPNGMNMFVCYCGAQRPASVDLEAQYRAQDDRLTEALHKAYNPPVTPTKEEIQKMVADEVEKQKPWAPPVMMFCKYDMKKFIDEVNAFSIGGKKAPADDAVDALTRFNKRVHTIIRNKNKKQLTKKRRK